jgi:hypothetical protein
MLRTWGILFGLAFLLIGILGFVPAASPNGLLLGIFHVNLIHNVIHLITGAIALWTGLQGTVATRYFFQYFGIIYAIVTVLGFIYGEKDILGLIANNAADNWLHLIIAAVSLYLGFLHKE